MSASTAARQPGLETASSSRAAHQTVAFLSFLSAPLSALPVCPCGVEETATLGYPVVGCVLISSFAGCSPFLPCFSRGTPRAGGACSCDGFCGRTEKISQPEAELASARRTGIRPPCPREEVASEKEPERGRSKPAGGNLGGGARNRRG